MKTFGSSNIIPFVLLIFLSFPGDTVFAQNKIIHYPDTLIIAGKQYDRPAFHQWLWGRHYRVDWATPVRVPFINLDTVNGGLTAYRSGGGRQSKTIRLKNDAGKEYVIRSIDKSFGKALPELYKGTFIERIMNDQVSIAEPYAAVTIAPMAEAAKIYHTNPVIGFVPRQDALGEFNEEYGNSLYLLEQRPDENWEEAENFGNAKKIVGTEKMLENIWEDNDNRIDQAAFVKARLFDMFIGDWSRHEDQWRWGVQEDGDKKTYVPIPRDRDQAYTKFDGALLSLAISAAAGHLEGFGPGIKNIDTYNYPARNLDRRATNEITEAEWLAAAKELKQALTDEVIEDAIHKLPPEIFSNQGPWIIKNLKSRRDILELFASGYYESLAREVEIVGTHKAEYFKIDTEGPAIRVRIYDLDKKGEPREDHFYSRVFHPGETKEIRIYGLAGEDRYSTTQNTANSIRIRLIGGPNPDRYSFAGTKNNIHLYDNSLNETEDPGDVRMHISENPFIHYYNYEGFNYDEKGLGPVISYNSEDHIHAGLKFTIEKQKWRKYPFGSRQELAAKYSISEGAFSFGYEGKFNQVAGNWNLLLNADYDQVRWNNFFGIGNETEMGTEDRDYYRVRTREIHGVVGLEKLIAHHHLVNISGLYQSIRVLNDPGRFLTERSPKLFHLTSDHFAGGKLEYSYNKLNDQVVPTKGVFFKSAIRYLKDLKEDSSVINFSGEINVFLPLSSSFVFSLKTGGASITGHPEFYQLNRLGGAKSLRGFRKYRFYGKTIFYNQAEIQYIRDIRTFLVNGKAGLIGLYDIGRVWQPGENSDTWHSGYGAGIMLAPFHKFSVAVFYALSKDERDISVRFIKGF